MSNICRGIPPNPDISGIGNRANLYATVLITSFIPRRRSTEKLLDALNTNAGVTGFGLLITAIIQTFQGRLDLYHAIVVFNIVYTLGLIAYFSGVFPWTIAHIRLGAIIQVMTISAFLAWSLYIWLNADTFGSTPECNANVKYVILFISVKATASWLRKFWIIWLGVLAACMVIGIIAAIYVIRWARREGINEDDLNLEKYSRMASIILSLILLEIAIASMALTELLIARNQHLVLPGEIDWTFGQVLSFVMIVANLREILNFLT